MVILLVLALATLFIIAAMGLELGLGNRLLIRLGRVEPFTRVHPLPPVSVIIPARNEAGTIEAALRSVAGQDYPRFEVIVLDDRSDDATGAIIDRMASELPGLRAVHVRDVPPGWLGKNHALWVGAGQAKGELLLFTDADVMMERTLLSRAVTHMTKAQLDHLAVIPRVDAPGLALQACVNGFVVFFCSFYKPWRARRPGPYHIGIGAFNLLRAGVYRRIGTHQAIAMCPDDDMKLGKLVKIAGFRQDVVDGHDVLSVRWYESVGGLVRGLTKNAFAATDYRVVPMVFAILAQVVVFLWPLAALALTTGTIRWLNAASVLCSLLMFRDTARFSRFSPVVALGYPFAVAVTACICGRAMVLNLAQGGIAWRGTRYPLQQLRANRV